MRYLWIFILMNGVLSEYREWSVLKRKYSFKHIA